MDDNEEILYLAALAKDNLAVFPKLVSNNKNPPHLNFLADKIQAAVEAPKINKFRILIVPIPPRHGKTVLCSYHFPAWYLGKFPKNRMILASYGADLASTNSAKARDIFELWGPKLFNVNPSKSIFKRDEWETEFGGGVKSAGVDGGLTGYGGDCVVIDDYLKNPKDAESEIIRKSQWDWWEAVVSTRLHPGAVIIIPSTRWHEDDLVGRIKAQHEELGKDSPFIIEEIKLPALAIEDDPLGRKPGEALWPWWMNEQTLKHKKEMAGSYHWNALFMGSPVSRGGNLFKKDNFRYYEKKGKCFLCYRMNEIEPLVIYETDLVREAFVDPAIEIKKENDPTGLSAWGYNSRHNIWILLEARSERIEHTQVNDYINNFAKRNGCIKVNIENEKLGKVLVKTSFGKSNLPFSEYKTGGLDKYARATTMATGIENQRVFFPREAPWLTDYENQLIKFPRDKHDEFVDVTSMAEKMESGLSFSEILAARSAT